MLKYWNDETLRIAVALKKKCTSKEKVVYICGVPTIMPKNQWDLFVDSICNIFKRKGNGKAGK